VQQQGGACVPPTHWTNGQAPREGETQTNIAVVAHRCGPVVTPDVVTGTYPTLFPAAPEKGPAAPPKPYIPRYLIDRRPHRVRLQTTRRPPPQLRSDGGSPGPSPRFENPACKKQTPRQRIYARTRTQHPPSWQRYSKASTGGCSRCSGACYPSSPPVSASLPAARIQCSPVCPLDLGRLKWTLR
jgi:hypothetical protein